MKPLYLIMGVLGAGYGVFGLINLSGQDVWFYLVVIMVGLYFVERVFEDLVSENLNMIIRFLILALTGLFLFLYYSAH
ncbi:MAG: hypothetical protein Q8862_07375 [Bacteroidota bacterium]|nr:hypothetical protein [Bacteroidota bacterium]